ncbi:hypothetical protein PNOK_0414500 [Pyrrhoderma noxium]|uniref:Retrotransposon gag domain-containing protein n=1 Tax=Pyrrhoderma noxium TaxID=2282107 RepID=A0A286UPL0_9AGAM|nr:hypothetical protein PNOK_0414500 [Pyrrhoderma noxium]
MEQHWNNLGAWADFEQAFKDRFITSDEAGEAIRELNKLKVKNQKYNEYINTFQMLARQAKITEYNALMPYFLQGLPTKLVESAYNSTQLLDTMDKWYDYNNQNNQGSSNPRPSGFFKQRQVRQTETEEQPEAPAPQMMEYGLSSKARAAHIATLLGGITEEERNSIFSELNEQGF